MLNIIQTTLSVSKSRSDRASHTLRAHHPAGMKSLISRIGGLKVILEERRTTYLIHMRMQMRFTVVHQILQ